MRGKMLSMQSPNETKSVRVMEMTSFPIAVELGGNFNLGDLERAKEHFLDTVVIPVHEKNLRVVLNAVEMATEQGWGLRFFLWAKDKQVESASLHQFGSHFQSVKVSHDKPQWAWVSVQDAEGLVDEFAKAFLNDAKGICFSRLPTERDVAEREKLKVIASLAVRLRVWQPLIEKRTRLVEVHADNTLCQSWVLDCDQWLTFCVPSSDAPVRLRLPFVVPEGVRAYGLRFPTIKRLPLQRKGNETMVKLGKLSDMELVWLTADAHWVARMHQRTGELLPKAMQFAVQWAIVRQAKKAGVGRQDIEPLVWAMLQAAKRRQFSKGYLLAKQIIAAYRM